MNDERITVKGLAQGLALLIEAVREQNQGQRQRLLIMDSQIRLLKEFADRLEGLETRFEQVLTNFQAGCQVCARLNIICSPTGNKQQGPQKNGTDKETLPDWIG
jgi:hypothetical protein